MNGYGEAHLDSVDLRLVKELETDGRQTVTDLAKKLRISQSTARRRLKALIDQRTIKIVALAYPPHLGYEAMATLGINVYPGQTDLVAERLCQYKNVHNVLTSAGRYDIIAWILFRNSPELSDFVGTELGNIQGLRSVETLINLKVKKNSHKYVMNEEE